MARIKPGTLSGSAVPLWTQQSIRGPRTSRRRRKEAIKPQEILAWFNLAQTLAQDESILGGIVNAVARNSREAELKQIRADELAQTQRVGRTPLADRPTPAVPVGPQQPTPQDIARQFVSPQPQAPQGYGDLREPGWREGLEQYQPQPIAQPIAQPVPQTVPQQVTPATVASRPEDLAALAGTQIGETPSFEQALIQQAQVEKDARVARAAEFAKTKAFTYQDLMGLAASAEDGEQLRHVMAMVPQVMKQDPAFAPRSLSGLLFGTGGPSANEVTKSIVSTFLSRRGKERTPEQRMGDIAKASKAFASAQATQAMVPSRRESTLAGAAKKWSGVDLDRARAEKERARAEKIRKDAMRRSKLRKSGRGGRFIGTKEDINLSKFGLYLDQLRSAGGDHSKIKDKAMIPKEFLVADGSPMTLQQASGLVQSKVGTKGARQVSDQVKWYLEGIKPPKAPSATTPRGPSGLTPAQDTRRADDAIKDLERTINEYNDTQATATAGKHEKRPVAEEKLPGKKSAMERAVVRANKLGLDVELTKDHAGKYSFTSEPKKPVVGTPTRETVE